MSDPTTREMPETVDLPAEATIVDVQRLVDPGEPGRFWLAISTSTLVVGLALVLVVRFGGWLTLIASLLLVLVVWVSVWLALQVARARLLGSAVRVTDRSLPELAALISDQRDRLNYTKRVDFYVADEVDGLVHYTSYFGTKVVIVKGDLVADLGETAWMTQSAYLMGSVLGHLAAKHLRFGPMLIGIEAVSKTKVFNLLLSPYFRATWYSGDNIGLYLCRDPAAGVQLMHRLLVGKDLSPGVNVAGIVEQVQQARQRRLTRFTELVSDVPHMMSRYLNLLRFFDHEFPDEASRWRDGLEESTRSLVNQLLLASRYENVVKRRGAWGAASSAICLAVVIAVAFLVLPLPHSAQLSTTTLAGSPQVRLRETIPSSVVPGCSPGSDGSQLFGTFSGVSEDCQISAGVITAQLSYYAFTDATGMQNGFEQLTGGQLPEGACTAAGAETSYGSPASGGDVACYRPKAGQSIIAWTTRQGVLGVLVSPAPMEQLYQVWQSLP
jgi:hypothetical protein